MFWAAAGVVTSVIPAIVRDVFHGSYTDASIYRGLIAAGLAGGAAVLTLLGQKVRTPACVIVSLLGAGVWVLALDAALVFKLGRVFSGVCLFFVGVAGAGILVTVMVVIQRYVPDSRRGRVFGVADMCTMAAMVAATGGLALPHAQHLDRYIPWLLGLTGAGLLGTLAAAVGIYRRPNPWG